MDIGNWKIDYVSKEFGRTKECTIPNSRNIPPISPRNVLQKKTNIYEVSRNYIFLCTFGNAVQFGCIGVDIIGRCYSMSSSSRRKLFNSGKSRNSLNVILKVMAILWRVLTFGFLLVPRMMLSTVDCFSPLMVASLLMVMPCLTQSWRIRWANSCEYSIVWFSCSWW